MSKNDSPSPGFDWADTQRRFLEAVSSLGGGRDPSNPWQQALEFWWQRAMPDIPDEQGVLSNLLRQSQSLFGLNEQFGSLLGDMAACGPADDWQAVLNSNLDAIKCAFAAQAGDPAGRPASAAPWQVPMDTWARTLSWLSALPAGFDGGGREGEAFTFPVPPSLGGSRRFQERQQRALELWNAYQAELRAYQSEIARVGARAVDIMRDRIIAMAAGAGRISSLRELYDLWADCCEEAYGKEVMTDEYAAHYGRVVNSLVAFKRHSQVMVDEILSTLNLPTQSGMDTMRKRQQEIRRGLRSAAEREQDHARAIADLKRELEVLRRELDGLSPPAGDSGDEPE